MIIMELCTDSGESSSKDSKNTDPTGIHQVKKVNTRKSEKICNVKDPFPPMEIPKESVHIIKSIDDWESIAEIFLGTVYRSKVCRSFIYESVFINVNSVIRTEAHK